MQSLRDIKRRIRSVKNISQITKAMEVVSMTKMRRSQGFALAARPYALASLDTLKNLLTMTEKKDLPDILIARPVTTALLVVITADKGLVGNFNDAVIKKAEKWVKEKQEKNIAYKIIAVGKKAKDYFERRNVPLEARYTGFGDYTLFKDTKPVADAVLAGFHEKRWDAVDMIYTHFKTTLSQETEERTLLPATQDSLEEFVEEIIPEAGRFSELRNKKEQASKYNYTYIFEPSPQAIIGTLVNNLLRIAVHHVMLESNASEHSARMVTMKNASENAEDLGGKLGLQYNKARQAGITGELSEIIAGAEALS